MVTALAIGAPACTGKAAPPPAPTVADAGLSRDGSGAEGRRGVIADAGLSRDGSGAEGRRGVIDPAYAADIGAICDALHRSNADQLSVSARTVTVAMWLGDNLKTAEARAFLVRTQPLIGDAKAAALEAEQAKVGLAACPLALAWRAAATTPTGGAPLP